MPRMHLLAWIVCIGLSAGLTHAAPILLQDAEASLSVIPAPLSSGWTINGVSYLSNESFWFRVGNSDPERPIGVLGSQSLTVTDTNGDGFNDTYSETRTNSQGTPFTVTFTQTLTGGSDTSDLAQVVKIKNTGQTTLDFHLFDYADFELSGSANGDSVVFDSGNLLRQTKGAATLETVFTPAASHVEAAYDGQTLASLNDALPTTLNDNLSTGPGDVTWAIQWDFTIAPGKTVLISKDEQITTPEPVTMLLLGLASVGLLRRRKS